MNLENRNHNLLIVALMEEQIDLYTNLQQNFGDLVDQLAGLANQIKGYPIAGLLLQWSFLEGIYAEIHYERNFYKPEEVAVLCGALTSIIKFIKSYKESNLEQFTTQGKDEVSDWQQEPKLPPIIITDSAKRTNLHLLIELEQAIYFYSNRRNPLENLVPSLQKVINALESLSITTFLSSMTELKAILANIDNTNMRYTFKQAAMICKQLVETTKEIAKYKDTYLADPYENKRVQGMLANWPEEIENLKAGFISTKIREHNIISTKSMIEHIENYGVLMSPILPDLIQDIEKQSISIVPLPIKGLLEELIKLKILTEEASRNKKTHFTFDETALIFGSLNQIFKLLCNYEQLSINHLK